MSSMGSMRRWFYVCLMGMVHDKDIENDMQGVDEQWTELIDLDRSELWHVTETTYQFFMLLSTLSGRF